MPDLPWDLVVMPLSMQERHHCTKGCMKAREGVPQRDVGADGWSVQVPIEMPDAAIGLAHAGVAGQVSFGTCLAVATYPGVNQSVL